MCIRDSFDSAEKAKADATKTQIRGLETALDLYRLHNSRYPSSEQGLKALLKIPEVGLIPKNLNGPYLRGNNLPEDGIRDVERSRGLGDVYKRQVIPLL